MLRLNIRPQLYPCHDGSCPLSWAVFNGEEFLCYSWSLSGALFVFRYLLN